ncbi:PIN domain-containing protein [Clavibacter sp. CT19]|uniref:PIN domain-containing protein n=1 Tax=Clavibacter sp. CT19 TaxID=3018990 RepID=UPI0022EA3067|nr:PIN domain-containing protein [Clavibacter sp. CT19]MDA3806227.1 PIN domain-containing protein [Clavibacter sp. CT19]
MQIQRVFVDANVIFSRTQRDWLFMLRVETAGMFQLHTTEDVLAEAFSSLRDSYPDMSGGSITALRKRLIAALDELVPDFDTDVPYTGKDPDDLHVHAAALACHAHVLLTDDDGFDPSDEDPYEVFKCDDFFILIDDSAPWMVQRVVQKMNEYWSGKPGGGKGSLAKRLRDADCPQFAARVDRHLRTISGAKRR